MTAAPETINITVYQGETWREDQTLLETLEPLVPFDLTGYSAAGDIRTHPDQERGTKIGSLSFEFVDRAGGVLTEIIDGAVTAAISPRRTAYYDVWLTKDADPTETFPIVRGTITAIASPSKRQET